MSRTLLALWISGLMTVAMPGLAAVVGTPLATEMDPDQAKTAMTLFSEEAQALERALDGKLRVVVLETSDPIARNFIAKGVLHTDNDTFQHQENGLAAIMAEGGQINGERASVCYVVFNRERAGHVWRNFLQPLAKGADLHPGAAFLVGHEVGHCLDHFERSVRLRAKTSTLAEAGTFGIQPDAWTRSGGGAQVNQEGYSATAKALFSDGAQRQYQERVADAFGVLWGWHREVSADLSKIVRQNRGYAETWSSHATAPALEGIDQFHDQAKLSSLPDLWILARGFQVRASVDKRLLAGGDKAGEGAIANNKAIAVKAGREGVAAVVQTPPQAVPAPAPVKPVRQLDGLGRVKFGSLRRFGSGVNGVNGGN